VAFQFLFVVISSGPERERKTAKGEVMHGVSKEFVAGESKINVTIFTASFRDRSGSGEALNIIKVGKLITLVSKAS